MRAKAAATVGAALWMAIVIPQCDQQALAQQLFAQQGAAPREEPSATDTGLATPKQVDIQPTARDEEIAQRLQGILDATEWYEAPRVTVDDGVVFLEGIAESERYRVWAGDLARNTQDVAAVVNRMSVIQRPLWDLEPALAELRGLSASVIQSLPFFLFALIVLLLTWAAARFAKRVSGWLLQRRVANPLLRSVLVKASGLPIVLLGIYVILRVSGLTQLALAVLGGTGLAGLIIGIAFRDIAENFLASILISIQNPFRMGDLVDVAENTGFVQRVSTRGTLLMTLDGNHVLVPNAIIYKSIITNLSANPNRRIEFVVGIGYENAISHAQQTTMQVLRQHPKLLNDPEPRVLVDALGAATVNLRVYAWLDAAQHSYDGVRSSVMRLVKQGLLNAGISLPDEAREVIFPSGVPVRMLGDDKQAIDIERGDERQSGNGMSSHRIEEAEHVDAPGESAARSEAAELQQQADQSWQPEKGDNLLTNQ